MKNELNYTPNEPTEEIENNITISNQSDSIKTEEVIALLKNIYDPEIHYSIYDIGLIYEIHINNEEINIIMTLTSPSCPEAVAIPDNVFQALGTAFPKHSIQVELTFDPPWTIDNMTENTKLGLGLL